MEKINHIPQKWIQFCENAKWIGSIGQKTRFVQRKKLRRHLCVYSSEYTPKNNAKTEPHILFTEWLFALRRKFANNALNEKKVCRTRRNTKGEIEIQLNWIELNRIELKRIQFIGIERQIRRKSSMECTSCRYYFLGS